MLPARDVSEYRSAKNPLLQPLEIQSPNKNPAHLSRFSRAG
jgi:hypothetical protein